jgi:hypothetical protein
MERQRGSGDATIDQQMQESGQKFSDSINAAATQMGESVATEKLIAMASKLNKGDHQEQLQVISGFLNALKNAKNDVVKAAKSSDSNSAVRAALGDVDVQIQDV